MRFLILAAAVAMPAHAASDFDTKAGCMNRLAREIGFSDALTKQEKSDYWPSLLSPARPSAPDAVDRMVEIKGEIAALQSELVDQMMKVCASYD